MSLSIRPPRSEVRFDRVGLTDRAPSTALRQCLPFVPASCPVHRMGSLSAIGSGRQPVVPLRQLQFVAELLRRRLPIGRLSDIAFSIAAQTSAGIPSGRRSGTGVEVIRR